MFSGFGILLVFLVIGVAILALFLAIGALFPQVVEKGREVLELKPGSSFLIGLVNLIFFGAIFAASSALNSRSNLPLLLAPGILALLVIALGVLLGLTCVAWLLGGRLWPEQSPLQQSIRGGAVLVLAGALPFVGWYLALPYFAIVGLGATVRALFQREGGGKREVAPEE